MDKVSIIVPVYKVENMINQCIKSIISQSYNNIEIILVDDGSPDNCGAICDVYAEKDARIKVIHQKNQGLSAARNAGLDLASGAYIAFVDSDDIIHKDTILDNLKLLKYNNADMIIFNCIEVEGNKKRKINYIKKDSFISRAEALIKAPVLVTLKIYKKELFANLRFPVKRIHEDNFIFPEVILKANKIFCNTKAYYYYTMNPNSIMHNLSFHSRYDAFLAYENKLNIAKKYFPQVYNIVLNETFDMAFRVYNLNYIFNFLNRKELECIQSFFYIHKSDSNLLSFANKVFLFDFMYIGYINRCKAMYYKFKFASKS